VTILLVVVVGLLMEELIKKQLTSPLPRRPNSEEGSCLTDLRSDVVLAASYSGDFSFDSEITSRAEDASLLAAARRRTTTPGSGGGGGGGGGSGGGRRGRDASWHMRGDDHSLGSGGSSLTGDFHIYP